MTSNLFKCNHSSNNKGAWWHLLGSTPEKVSPFDNCQLSITRPPESWLDAYWYIYNIYMSIRCIHLQGDLHCVPKASYWILAGTHFGTPCIHYIIPRAQMFVSPWVSSLDELTRVRLFRSLLTLFFWDWPNKVGYKHIARGKRTCSLSIQPLHLCVFYLQAYCFKHRGVKQDYDSSKSVFFLSSLQLIWID